MASPEQELEDIHEAVIAGKMIEGQARLLQLLESIPPKTVKALLPSFEAVIKLFYHKRQRDLSQALLSRVGEHAAPIDLPRTAQPDRAPVQRQTKSILQPSSTAGTPQRPPSSSIRAAKIDDVNPAVNIRSELRTKFVELSMDHMWEWRTFYRDAVTQMFDRIEGALRESVYATDICSTVSSAFLQHAQEIFGRGFTHLTENKLVPHRDAITTELRGLQRFLELPLEFYSLRAANAPNWTEARAIRATGSAMIAGIIEGFGETQFGQIRGWKILPQNARPWAHYLGFLGATDIDRLETKIAASPLRDGIRDSVSPVIRALDQVLSETNQEAGYLPGLSQFNSNSGRLELSLLIPASAEMKRYLDIHCYLMPSHVSQAHLLESASRGTSLIAAPMRSDLQEWVDTHELVRTTVVNTASGDTVQTEQAAAEILRFEIGRYSKLGDIHAPLKYNFARNFPLHDPNHKPIYHVHRVSVRNLLRTFDDRNGIRLWCSVRRSGKTTASSDLGGTTEDYSVITQTCDNTEQNPDSGRFYQAFIEALQGGQQIPTSFFTKIVADCLKEGGSLESKVVLVLDEYETLFGRMGAALKRDRELRYTVIQPLLNQMVAFSRQNLLILIGQRPDAHFIIMDQNQLSPYVEQDSFPLFEHSAGASSSEFRNLLNKIFTNRTTFDDAFVNVVYRETGGHPWLTVNLLVDFFDWLIEGNRSIRNLHFTDADFAKFAEDRLVTNWISICEQYDFFRKVISEALSEYGQEWDPWLHAVYATIRRIAEENPSGMSCSRSRFANIIDELKLPQEFGYKADDLLRTAVPSNFLAFDGDNVGPRIPLMARISMAAHPKVAW